MLRGGQFAPEKGGQFKPEWVVSLFREKVVNYTGISNLRAYPAYNMFEGYHYSNDDGSFDDIIIDIDKNKNVVALHIPMNYKIRKGIADEIKFDWSVITLK